MDGNTISIKNPHLDSNMLKIVPLFLLIEFFVGPIAKSLGISLDSSTYVVSPVTELTCLSFNV